MFGIAARAGALVIAPRQVASRAATACARPSAGQRRGACAALVAPARATHYRAPAGSARRGAPPVASRPAPRRRMATAPHAAGAAAAGGAAKTVLVPVGNGTEEMEAVIVIDVLRRAGAAVTVASVEPTLEVACSRGVRLVADAFVADVAAGPWDLVALPGGMPGAERLRDCAPLSDLLRRQSAEGRLHAAICATPAVFLQPIGLLDGRRATAHPAFSERLADQSAVAQRVVVDGPLTTSRGPGTAFEFALSLVAQLYGDDKAREVAAPMVMPP